MCWSASDHYQAASEKYADFPKMFLNPHLKSKGLLPFLFFPTNLFTGTEVALNQKPKQILFDPDEPEWHTVGIFF